MRRGAFLPAAHTTVQYGPGVRALGVALTAQHLLPVQRSADVVSALIGHASSPTTLFAAERRVAAAVAPALTPFLPQRLQRADWAQYWICEERKVAAVRERAFPCAGPPPSTANPGGAVVYCAVVSCFPRSSRRAAIVALALGVLAAACGPSAPVAPDDQTQLADGARFADSLAAAAAWDDAGVVALGYFERLRLGLGSPFRLAEHAAGDARLGAPLGRRVAWGVLAGTLRGQAFAIDSAALGDAADALAPGGNPDGGWHRALIDSAVRVAPTARTGEEAVRVTYALARAEGLVTARVAQAAVHAAALARDRYLAADDVRALLAASRTSPGRDALSLLRDWRLERRFLSEAALLSDALTPDAPGAVREAEQLLVRMRGAGVVARVARGNSLLATAPSDSVGQLVGAGQSAGSAGAPGSLAGAAPVPRGSVGPLSTRPLPGGAGVLIASPPVVAGHEGARIGSTPAARRDDGALGAMPLAAARRLAELPSARAAYPTAPVMVTLGGFHHALAVDTLAAGTAVPGLFGRSEPGVAAGQRVRARLITRARTEELLAAEWVIARATAAPGSTARRELAGLVQATAVALRPWAQAPGVGVAVGAATGAGSTAVGGASAEVDALRLRDGYRALAFDPGTPPLWRAAAARQLGDAVADLRGAFPDLALDGLAVRVGESPRRDLALALHEPGSRTVYLPPSTGAGTVAHELVHDLDWQAARARLAVTGGYGTDRLARSGNGELAQAVRGLAGARPGGRSAIALGATAPGTLAIDADRPAERLARGADFYVAAALARDGRANGVLSTVQDPVLTGYAGVVAPEPGDGSAEALVQVLGAVTRLSPATRAWYLARFGSAGVRSPLGVAQFALGALPGWEAERTLRGLGVPGGMAVATDAGASSCAGVGGGRGAAWQPRLIWLAADARARGVVRQRASHAAVGGAWWGWSTRGLLGGPWSRASAEASVARVRDAILRVAMAEARRASGSCGVLSTLK